MSEMQYIQWFPGHMTKTKRQIQANLKLVDAVAEIVDSRIPVSSRNPDISSIIESKPRIVLLNKCDMANKSATDKWIEYYKSKGVKAIAVDCKSGRGINNFIPAVNELLADKIEAWKSKGMINRSIRVMIVGIPNVGKSSFINKIARQNKAKAEDRPGVTRGNQWFTISKSFELLDTPGVLWPKFDDQTVAERLAFTGAVKDQIMDVELLAVRLLDLLKNISTPEFVERFKLSGVEFSDMDSYELLELIGRKRGMLMSGGHIDTERASTVLLDEFRASKLGKITLELPQHEV